MIKLTKQSFKKTFYEIKKANFLKILKQVFDQKNTKKKKTEFALDNKNKKYNQLNGYATVHFHNPNNNPIEALGHGSDKTPTFILQAAFEIIKQKLKQTLLSLKCKKTEKIKTSSHFSIF